MNTVLPLGIHFGVTREQYVADPGYNQSALKSFAKANSPAHFKWDKDHPTLQDKDYIRIGNFVDCAVFHPDKLDNAFAIWSGERRGKDWIAFRDAHPNNTILNEAEHRRALGALYAIRQHKDAMDSIKASKHHAVAIASHPVFGYRLKAELDMLPPYEFEWVFDLKTAEDAGRDVFHKQAFNLGYDVQACWYMDILSFLPEPIQMNNFGFFIAETNPPHGVKLRHFRRDSRIIESAREKINTWLPAYHDCVINNRWPGYDDKWEEITFDYWMLKDRPQEGEALE